jgi:hypothetical protein
MIIQGSTDSTKCILAAQLVLDTNDAIGLGAPDNAIKAIIQFFTDQDGIDAIGTDKIGYTPIVQINEENPAPPSGPVIRPAHPRGGSPPTPWASDSGILLYHMGIYEVTAPINLASTKIMRLSDSYTVYCRILFYK